MGENTYNNYEDINGGPVQKQANNSLRIYTLGQFSVYRGPDMISPKSGRLNKSWELFVFLVTFRNKLFPVEVIQESLWPDSDSPDPLKNLKNQVHRLRKALDISPLERGYSSILYSHGCYKWNSEIDHWLDVEIFEDLCQKAAITAGNDPAQAVNQYLQALNLYRGDYLPEFPYSEWVIPIRHYYRRLFLNSVIRLLDLYKAKREFSELARICEKTFIIEQFEEELHLRYMEALIEEGKMSQARDHYQYITALLYREFGAKPSSAMQSLYRRVKISAAERDHGYEDIRELLKDSQENRGALLCDADSFELICRLEQRRAKRESRPLFVATLTLTGPDFRLPPPGELQEAMEKLKRVLLYNLRCGDVVSPWNESQFVILLSGVQSTQAEAILSRLTGLFNKSNPTDMVVPRGSLHPLGSPQKP